VILTTKGIDDTALKYFVEAGAIACRRVPREDMRCIAKATGAEIVFSLANNEGNETFDSRLLGQAEMVYEQHIAEDDILLFKNCKIGQAVCLLLRGANEHILDEMDRSLHDALSAIKRVLEGGAVVPGGGAVEASLSVFLENYAAKLGSREQLAIVEFANALLVIPKTLAVNAAMDSTELVAKLRAYHFASQVDESDEKKLHFLRFGLELSTGTIRDNVEAGILEPAIAKVKMVQFATEAAITVLRIDDLVKLEAQPEANRTQG